MLRGLYTYYLTPKSFIDRNFKVNAGESARGIRFILDGFRELHKLNFRHVIKIEDNLFENVQIIFNEEEGYVDIIFPSLKAGKYKSEIAIICEGRKLLSGIFELEYLESLIGGHESKLEKLDAIDIFERLVDSQKNIDDLVERTKELSGVVDKNYIYEQIQASNVWTIHHNLNKYPSVNIIDSGNNEIYGEVRYLDKNNIILKFSVPFSGKAFLN